MRGLRPYLLPSLGVLLPLLLGLAARLALAAGWAENPVLFLRADLGTLLLFLGLLCTLLAAAGTGLAFAQRKRFGRQLEETRQHALEDRRRFLRRLDHELKNPLTAIQAGLGNLGREDGAETAILESVQAQTQRLNRLVSDLRKLADLEALQFEHEAVDMQEVLEEAVELAQDLPQAGDRKVTLTVLKSPWPLPKVSGDRDLLFLAVHNLLSNAVKFTQPGQSVEARLYEDGANLVVEVADSGPGIPEADLPYVWDELYRGENARGVPGSGLGLALVRAIITRHGGQTQLRSRVGQGTLVALRLPAA